MHQRTYPQHQWLPPIPDLFNFIETFAYYSSLSISNYCTCVNFSSIFLRKFLGDFRELIAIVRKPSSMEESLYRYREMWGVERIHQVKHINDDLPYSVHTFSYISIHITGKIRLKSEFFQAYVKHNNQAGFSKVRSSFCLKIYRIKN